MAIDVRDWPLTIRRSVRIWCAGAGGSARRRARREAMILGVLAEGQSCAQVARGLGVTRQAVGRVLRAYKGAMREAGVK